jgi:hypothetical protein
MSSSYRVVEVEVSRADLLLAGDAAAWEACEAIRWGPEPWTTTFRAAWSRAALYLRFDAADDRPWHTLTARDDRLWTEEVVEIFIDPTGSGRDYAELEISPANIVCDLIVVRPSPDLYSDPAWHFASIETRVTPWRAPESGPAGWSATAAIPWQDFANLPTPVPLPPRRGDTWHFNVFRIKRPHGPAAPEEGAVYAAWSPTGGPSFHVPSVFREFRFS